MRLQAIKDFRFRGFPLSPGNIFEAPEDAGLVLVDQDYAILFNLEDPSKRSVGVFGELIPEVPAVELNPTSDSMPLIGGSGSFSVIITGPGISGTWTAEQDAVATWLTITDPTVPQTEDGHVSYTVSPNGGAPRAANIYVNGKTFSIDQTGT